MSNARPENMILDRAVTTLEARGECVSAPNCESFTMWRTPMRFAESTKPRCCFSTCEDEGISKEAIDSH